MTDKMPERAVLFRMVGGDLHVAEPGESMSLGNASGAEYVRADLLPQWQPIETAPRDGTPIGVWCRGDGRYYCVFWRDGDHRYPSGWVVRGGNWRAIIQGALHWIPLPEPPK